MKGTYLLILELLDDVSIQIGKLGFFEFQKGCYVYVGSGLNGLEQRIRRHLREKKKIHWHIDYFLPFARIVEVFYKESARREECEFAKELAKDFRGVPGFGCSDCSCQSHLFVGSPQDVFRCIDTLDMRQYLVYPNP